MAEMPFTNHGHSPVYIAGRMIPPGETRWVERSEVRRAQPPTPLAPPESDDPIDALLSQSMKALAPQLAELEDSLLEALAEREEARASPRRSLLDGIRAELLRRDVADDD